MSFKYLDKFQGGGQKGASEHQAAHRADLCHQVWFLVLMADVSMGSEPSVVPAELADSSWSPASARGNDQQQVGNLEGRL